jgi:CRISPR-associated exonuclease Cas4
MDNHISTSQFAELEPVAISALQHYVYCPRQCALIHVEQTFDDNLYTLRGHRMHERADTVETEWLDGVRIERALPLYSERLGLTGRADVVEFHHGLPYPVEYKSGVRQPKNADDIQLCAQAMCLEEMFSVSVPEGSLFYDQSKRRRIVTFTSQLREQVIEVAQAVRSLLTEATLPLPVADQRCDKCSLIEACMPFAVSQFDMLVEDVFKP